MPAEPAAILRRAAAKEKPDVLPARRLRLVLVPTVVSALLAPLLLWATATTAHAEPSAADLQQRITAKSTQVKALAEEYNEVSERFKQTRAAAAKHATSLPTLQAERDAADAEVQRMAAQEYKSGHLRGPAAVLTDNDRSALLSRLGFLDYLADTQQEQLATATTARDRYASVKEQLAAEQERQQNLMKTLSARKAKGEAELKTLYAMRRQAFGTGQESGASYTGPIPAVSGDAGVVVRFAYNAIGKPYSWADDGPNGYDCSGLTLAAWRTAGKTLPHNVKMQWGKVAHISRAQLAPGDLVFYSDLAHIGIYVGNEKVIHAPTFGEQVKISGITMLPIVGYGRVG